MYLIDTSALVRILRQEADPAWDALISRGLVSVCEPAVAETLITADASGYAALEGTITSNYLRVIMPDNIWDLVAMIRRELVPGGVHKCASVADLVIAATAIRLKLTVLHQDGDFETVARFVPELRQRSITAVPV